MGDQQDRGETTVVGVGGGGDAVVVRPAVVWRVNWVRGPRHDLPMALLWMPFALAAYVVGGDPERLRWLVSATLLFSFAHQPLTLWLVYGDPTQRRSHAALVVWVPVVLVVAVAVGSSVRPELVALVAGVWNVAHTLRQRYGVCRLYGRLNEIDCGGDNRLLWSWLLLAVVVGFARTDVSAMARSVGIGARNTTAVDAVASAGAVLTMLVPAVAVAIVVTVRWAGNEVRRSTHSVARLVYLASTAGLLVVVALDTIVGFVGYVGAHAAEYFVLVRWRVGRAAERSLAGDAVGGLARRVGGGGTIGLYAGAVTALIIVMRVVPSSPVTPVLILTLGTFHLFFDGVIWHSPRPNVTTTESA